MNVRGRKPPQHPVFVFHIFLRVQTRGVPSGTPDLTSTWAYGAL
nr:MAG TPA: hypothetical protein [Caudoviricetes sp.]